VIREEDDEEGAEPRRITIRPMAGRAVGTTIATNRVSVLTATAADDEKHFLSHFLFLFSSLDSRSAAAQKPAQK
jgi:hypothetical protein